MHMPNFSLQFFRVFPCLALGVACNFITDEELAYRQGGNSDCSDIWFLDVDGDGVGGTISLFACESPGSEYTQTTGDCDDENPTVSPLELEDCSTPIDEDCDGTPNAVDPVEKEPSSCIEWFADRDEDFFGDDLDVRCNCVAEDVYTALEGGDCYDQLSTVNPDQTEVCGDGFDNDCDGSANGCGYTEDFLLTDAQLIRGDTAQAYAGSNVLMGLFLSDEQPAVLVLSSGAENGVGRIDVFDAETLNTATTTLETTDGLSSIVGESDSDFGESIVGYNDIRGTSDVDLLVSAPGWTGSDGRILGKVYVIEGPLRGNIAAANAEVTLVGTGDGDRFGSAISTVGSQIWVGAQGADLGAVNAGGVFVYSASGELEASLLGTEPSMRFGASISRSTDFNGDGMDDVAVGAFGANGSKGSAFVYWNAGTLMAIDPNDADVAWNGTIPNEEAGRRVQVLGDVTGDGYSNLLIAAPNESRVYIVSAETSSTTLLDMAPIVIEGGAETALGFSTTEMGDFNGDGQVDVVLGGFLGSQIAIAYGPLLGTYTAEDLVVLENRGSDQLGWSLAGGVDITGDTVSDLLVGARTASDGLNKNGVVFLLEGRGL